MSMTDSQVAALKRLRDAKAPIGDKGKEHPDGIHHKTREGLAKRFLIEEKGDGYVITKAGREALAAALAAR